LPATELSDRDVRLLRLRAQGLLPGHEFSSVLETARGCLCLQAQDVPTARLALRARTTGLTTETAAEEGAGGDVCRCWLMRNTVHLFANDDLAWMRPLLAPTPMRQAQRRLEQLGVAAELPRALTALRRRLKRGPLSRDEARAFLAERGIEPGENNSAFYWTLHAAALQGILVMHPALDPKSPLAAAPLVAAPSGSEAGADWGRLARRYLQSYGPATVRDFAYWAKIKLADARRGWELADDAVEVATERGPMTALPGLLEPPVADEPVVRLLGTWDNYMLAHKGRELAVKPAHSDHLPLLSGFRCAIANGLVFASWRLERAKGSVTVAVEPFGRLPNAFREGLERETADLGRFLETEATLRIDRA
jgi:hypothetical protein